jgi:hypothetical protein
VWRNIDAALMHGARGLPGGSSLPRLLDEARGVRNRKALPALSIKQVLRWADRFFKATGRWPTRHDGPIPDAPGETWAAIDAALHNGCRGFRGGDSLAQLLERRRGVRNRKHLPKLTERQILRWARRHRRQTGKWPTENSGLVVGTHGEVWVNISAALLQGIRGLPGGDTLARLLARRLGARNTADLPRLTVKQILRWADTHHRRADRWPNASTGLVVEAPAENWSALDGALRGGMRGLARGLSLARLLARHRGVRNKAEAPRLTVRQILKWADGHFRRTGSWPGAAARAIADTASETWSAVDQSLRKGRRGLPGGDSLARLLGRHGRTHI